MAQRDDIQERNEQPTARRRREARREGRIARSRDLSAVVLGGGSLAALAVVGPWLLDALSTMTASMLWAGEGADLRPASVAATLSAVWPVVGAVGALAAMLVAVAVLANFVQVGWIWSSSSVRPNAERLSLGGGLRRLLSRRTLVRLALAAVKIAAAGGIAYLALSGWLRRIVGASALSPAGLIDEAGGLVLRLGAGLLGALAIVAAVDYLYQRWELERELRMTRGEKLDEQREAEGDRLTVSRRKRARERRGKEAADG